MVLTGVNVSNTRPSSNIKITKIMDTNVYNRRRNNRKSQRKNGERNTRLYHKIRRLCPRRLRMCAHSIHESRSESPSTQVLFTNISAFPLVFDRRRIRTTKVPPLHPRPIFVVIFFSLYFRNIDTG